MTVQKWKISISSVIIEKKHNPSYFIGVGIIKANRLTTCDILTGNALQSSLLYWTQPIAVYVTCKLCIDMLDLNRLCSFVFPRLDLVIHVRETGSEKKQQMQLICRGWWSNLLSDLVSCERFLSLTDVPRHLKQPNNNWESTTYPSRRVATDLGSIWGGRNCFQPINYITHVRCCMWRRC